MNFNTCTDSCYYHHNQDTEHFYHPPPPQISCTIHLKSHILTVPSSWQPLICFSINIGLPFQEQFIKGIIQNITLKNGFVISAMLPLGFIQVVTCIYSTFLFIVEEYSIVYYIIYGMVYSIVQHKEKYHSLFTHSAIEELLGCFQFGVIMNKESINTCVQALF